MQITYLTYGASLDRVHWEDSMWKYSRKVVKGHPYADKRSRVLVHRLILEKHLGRYLLPTEIVHHKDRNPRNNLIPNLEIVTSSSHNGCHTTGITMLTFQCKICENKFTRPKRGKTHTYCSRSCMGKDVKNQSSRRAGHKKYLESIRLSPDERKRRKAKRMRKWRERKTVGV